MTNQDDIATQAIDAMRVVARLFKLSDDHLLMVACRNLESATNATDERAVEPFEKIRSAAIRKDDAIYVCWAHTYNELRRMNLDFPDDGFLNCEQGFVTNTGRYVDRVEGLAIANAAGQVVHKHHPLNELCSEDMRPLPAPVLPPTELHGDLTFEEEVIWRRERDVSMLKVMASQGERIEELTQALLSQTSMYWLRTMMMSNAGVMAIGSSKVTNTMLADDEPHRWEIEPHYMVDFDVLVTNNDDEAREAILEIAEMYLWDSNEPGQERVMKVRMSDVSQSPRTVIPAPLTGNGLLPCPLTTCNAKARPVFSNGKVQCPVCWFSAPLPAWQSRATEEKGVLQT